MGETTLEMKDYDFRAAGAKGKELRKWLARMDSNHE
jgi:hypothetical protein